MNIKGILERVFDRINQDRVEEILEEKSKGWKSSQKKVRKKDLKSDFLELETIISPNEVEDFVEMAVMAKSIGLPAYTYKVKNTNFLEHDPKIETTSIINRPFQEKYAITVESKEDNLHYKKFTVRLKEYSEVWKSGVKNLESLSAVYKVSVFLDKEKKVATIFTGNHYVQRTISDFLIFVLKWPLQNFRIREHTNQSWEIGNASFKTALLLDFVSNRLKEKGVFSKFNEIKFNTTKNSKHKKEGIRNITINGRNLLSSHLACEYVTLGSDILSFKLNMSYDDQDFSALFYLKGTDLDILKIVVIGLEEVDFQQKVIDLIQEEYIDMCNNGIKELAQTKRLLEQIYEKFIHGDKMANEAIQESSLKIVESFVKLIDAIDMSSEESVKIIERFYFENKVILDTIGYDEPNDDIQKLKEIAGINDFDEFDDELDATKHHAVF